MDIIYLRPVTASDGAAPGTGGDVELLRELQDTLRQLKQVLHTVLLGSRGTRQEAQQWLINSIAGLELQDPATKRRRFTQFLPGGAACRGREHQALGQAMLQLLCEAAPAEVGALLAQDASLLRHFFTSDPKHVILWFRHFSMDGMRRFKHGAAALAQYALANRAQMWQLLEWQGRHPQAPVAVAQRTHYFCELDVPRTVRNLLRDCPEFWSSGELRRSVQDGAAQLLALDPAYWSKELMGWLEDRHSGSSSSSRGERLYALLCSCLEAGPWRQHCQRLLQLLPQQDLLPFATDLLGSASLPGSRDSRSSSREDAAVAAAAAAEAAPPQAGAWLVFCGVQWQTLDQLLLAAALGCSLPLLLRLLRDDELAEGLQQVQQLVQQLLLRQQQQQQQQVIRPDQPQTEQQQQLSQHQQQQPQADAVAATVAAHWRLRGQLLQQQQQRAAATGEDLHEMLLLHLFAAAFLVQQLSSSGSSSDAQQLQQLLTASGMSCQLAAPPTLDTGIKQRSRRHRSRKKRKQQRHSKGGGSRKEKKRKHQRRRSHSSSSGGGESDGGASSSSSSGGMSGGGAAGDSSGLSRQAFAGGSGGDWLALPAGSEAAADYQQQQQWRLCGLAEGGGGSSTDNVVSGLELLHAVIDATASAYADWLFGAGGSRRALGSGGGGSQVRHRQPAGR